MLVGLYLGPEQTYLSTQTWVKSEYFSSDVFLYIFLKYKYFAENPIRVCVNNGYRMLRKKRIIYHHTLQNFKFVEIHKNKTINENI